MYLKLFVIICVSFALGVLTHSFLTNQPKRSSSLIAFDAQDKEFLSDETIAGFKALDDNQFCVGPFLIGYSNDMRAYCILERSSRKALVSEFESKTKDNSAEQKKTITRDYFLNNEANDIAIYFEMDRESKKMLNCVFDYNGTIYLDLDGDGHWNKSGPSPASLTDSASLDTVSDEKPTTDETTMKQ